MPLSNIIGDYRAFFARQLERLDERGMDIGGCELSHLCYRTETYDEYLETRERLETLCRSNIENVWNGRPMSIMQLAEPRALPGGFEFFVVELIPPLHRRVYAMGLEHVGVVIGDTVKEFSRIHREHLTGQQFQSKECEPYYVTFFDDFTTVKFYDDSLLRICEKQRGVTYEGFKHVAGWQPRS